MHGHVASRVGGILGVQTLLFHGILVSLTNGDGEDLAELVTQFAKLPKILLSISLGRIV